MTALIRGIPNIDAWTARRMGAPAIGRPQIEAYQRDSRGQALARAAAGSPFYRQRYGDLLRTPGTDAEWERLPFTTAEDLREQSFRMLCVPPGEIERIVTLSTSGTTGAPKRIGFTETDQGLSVEYFQAGMGSFLRPGDRVMILMPGERPGSIGDLLSRALIPMGATPVRWGFVTDIPELLAELDAAPAEILVGVPHQVLALARCQEALGRPMSPRLRTVLLSSDSVPQAVASELGRIWNCETVAYYAMTELAYGGGIQCGLHGGYHLYEGEFFFEVIDPDTAEPVPDGSWGEVVVTTLTPRGMPMIRYRTGDVSRFLPGLCSCGSPLRRLDRIRHRLGSSPLLGCLDEALFSIPGVLDFAVRIPTQGNRLKLHLDLLGAPLPEEVYRDRILTSLESGLGCPAGPDLTITASSHGVEYRPSQGKRTVTKE